MKRPCEHSIYTKLNKDIFHLRKKKWTNAAMQYGYIRGLVYARKIVRKGLKKQIKRIEKAIE